MSRQSAVLNTASHPRQLGFLPRLRLDHGGDIRQGKRKVARPFDPGRALHVVLRATQAKGAWSLRHRSNRARVESILFGRARASGVRIRHLANAGNHLHLAIQAPTRAALQAFLRSAPGVIAMAVTGARKASPLIGRFWDKLVYSRVVGWGREWGNLKRYLIRNELEALDGLGRDPNLKVVTISGLSRERPPDA